MDIVEVIYDAKTNQEQVIKRTLTEEEVLQVDKEQKVKEKKKKFV